MPGPGLTARTIMRRLGSLACSISTLPPLGVSDDVARELTHDRRYLVHREALGPELFAHAPRFGTRGADVALGFDENRGGRELGRARTAERHDFLHGLLAVAVSDEKVDTVLERTAHARQIAQDERVEVQIALAQSPLQKDPRVDSRQIALQDDNDLLEIVHSS